jgi:hypothetical protein
MKARVIASRNGRASLELTVELLNDDGSRAVLPPPFHNPLDLAVEKGLSQEQVAERVLQERVAIEAGLKVQADEETAGEFVGLEV